MLSSSYLDLTVYMEVSASIWRQVLDAAGEHKRLAGEKLTPQSLLASLHAEDPGGELLEALEIIHELGTDLGREMLLQAADDGQVDLKTSDDEPARELAARVWLESRTSNPLALLLVRVRVRSSKQVQSRPCREFDGKGGTASSLDEEKLKAAVTQWCAENRKSEAIMVLSYRRGEERYYEVLRGEAIRRQPEVRNGRPAILNFRPLASDLLRYNSKTGRLGVATRSSRLLRAYQHVAGTLLANDKEFFFNENTCSLKPLQEFGSKVFERHLPPQIRQVDVVELRWRRGESDRLWVQGRDCFKILEDLSFRRAEGELTEAKLSIQFSGSARSGSVQIRIPNYTAMNVGGHEDIVERLLTDVGIRGSFSHTAVRDTLWTLFPWRASEARWRRFVRADFDRLLKMRIFVPTNLQAVTPPNHPALDGGLLVEAADAQTMVGVSEEAHIGLRTLTTSDYAGYSLDVERLLGKFEADLQIQGPRKEIDRGLWWLGTLLFSETTKVRVFLMLREPSDQAGALLHALAKGQPVVLIVPAGCTSTLNVAEVSWSLHGGSYDELLALIVDELGIQGEVSPERWAREPLIIDASAGKVWFQRELLSTLPPGSHAFKFALMLARAQGGLVSTEQINQVLSSNRSDGQAARAAKRALLSYMESSFKAAGKDWPKDEAKTLFDSPNHHYRVKAKCRVLS